MPQLAFEVVKSAHTPAQSVVPVGHAQALLTHTRLPPQTCPQKPQLVLSLVRFTHELPHRASPDPHAAEHCPMLHASPPMQPFPHDPQFAALDCKSAHTNPGPPLPMVMQAVSPAGHMHAPCMQGAPVGQAFPQAPQLAFDVCRSTHVMPPRPPMHAVSPVEQPCTQLPVVHMLSPGHRLPQPPQFLGSVCVSVHWTPHRVSPPPQLHAPPAQLAPVPQALAHIPQLEGSVWMLVHALLQSVRPAPHIVVHMP
jgi:hypothetical protein